jgi:hypothetical protein
MREFLVVPACVALGTDRHSRALRQTADHSTLLYRLAGRG